MSITTYCEMCREYNAAAVDYRNQAANAQAENIALLARHNALVEAVKKLTSADDDLMDAWDEKRANEMQKVYSNARDEVDRLIGEGK